MMITFSKKVLTGIFLVFAAVTCCLLFFRMPTLIFAIYAALALVLANRLGDRGFIVFVIAGTLLIRLAYVATVDTQPESDFKLLYDAAVSFAKGDYSFNRLFYFQEWAYQTGFVIYQGIIIRIFGEAAGIAALKILNCIWNTGITLLIYLIAKNFFSERSSRLAAVFYLGFVFPVTFVSILSNQHISGFLILLGVYVLIDRKVIKMKPMFRSIVAGFLLAVGNIMRPEALIVIASLAVYFFVLLFRAGDRRERIAAVVQFLAVLIVYFAVNGAASWAIAQSGINPYGLNNNNIYWKFVVGLNYEKRGSYNEQDYRLVYGNNLSPAERKELEKNIIAERLGIGPLKMVRLFAMKIESLWCDSALHWSYDYLLKYGKVIDLRFCQIRFSDIDAVMTDLNELFIFTAMILSFAGILSMRRDKTDDRLIIPVAVLVVSFIIYLFIEVQPRYAYLLQPFLFVLSGSGWEMLGRLDAAPIRQAWAELAEHARKGTGSHKG